MGPHASRKFGRPDRSRRRRRVPLGMALLSSSFVPRPERNPSDDPPPARTPAGPSPLLSRRPPRPVVVVVVRVVVVVGFTDERPLGGGGGGGPDGTRPRDAPKGDERQGGLLRRRKFVHLARGGRRRRDGPRAIRVDGGRGPNGELATRDGGELGPPEFRIGPPLTSVDGRQYGRKCQMLPLDEMPSGRWWRIMGEFNVKPPDDFIGLR